MSERFTELVEIAGREAALALCRVFGGLVVYFPTPERLSETHLLVQAVGWEPAVKIAEHWQGLAFVLPLGPEAGVRNGLQAQVLDMVAAGASANSIAKFTGLTVSTVRRIKRRGPARPASRRREPDPRLKLFED